MLEIYSKKKKSFRKWEIVYISKLMLERVFLIKNNGGTIVCSGIKN